MSGKRKMVETSHLVNGLLKRVMQRELNLVHMVSQ